MKQLGAGNRQRKWEMTTKWIFSLVCLALASSGACAFDLGKIQVNSTPNQPFKASIRLLGTTPEDLAHLKVGLAGPKAFRRAGIIRPFNLDNLRFKVEKSGTGGSYIEVTSHAPIREQFLDFLLELKWNNGHRYREYRVLLNPSNCAESSAVAARPSSALASTATGSVGGTPVPMHCPSAAAATTATSGHKGGGTYGATTATDTLWSIAKAVRPDDSVSVQQMMLALLKANPDAFNQDNVNALRKGAILQIPGKVAAQAVDPETALAVVRKQYALWDQYRQNQAASPSERASGAATLITSETGAVGAEAHDEGETHVNQISPSQGHEASSEKPGAPGGKAAEVESLRDQLAKLNKSLEAQKRQHVDLQSRLNETEQLVGSLRHQNALDNKQLAAQHAKLSGAGASPKTAPAAGQSAPTKR